MAQPNDVNQILGISKDEVPRRKEIKVKDKKKRPGMLVDLILIHFSSILIFVDICPLILTFREGKQGGVRFNRRCAVNGASRSGHSIPRIIG